jgi:hypothetical protein
MILMNKKTRTMLCRWGLIEKARWWSRCTLVGQPIKVKRKLDFLDIETINVPESKICNIEKLFPAIRVTRRCV